MHALPDSRLPHRPNRGFTLVELMIAVVVVGILAAIAIPNFMESLRKSRRSDAFGAIAIVQQAEERWRSSNASYASVNTAEEGAAPNGLTLPNTASGYYTLSLSGIDATTYTITATAVSSKSQAADSGCKLLAVRMTGGNYQYGSGDSALNWTDPARCWAQ